MDVNTILSHLVQRDLCFPAMKLAWNCQLELPELAEIPKISPSHYIREIKLNTEQRHSLLCQQQKKLEFWKPGFEFTVVPSIVVFQQYQGGETLNVNLSIRNISNKLQKVTLLMDETDVFSLEYKSTRIAKFASGMTISATIKFKPEDDKDYLHKIIIGTNNTRFAIPILGIGGRATLDIPDKLDFGKVPVKFLKNVTTSVCNTGSKYARFTLTADGPFCVTPEKGVVAPNDSFNLTISYYSHITDTCSGHLRVKFDNGEEIYTKLLAEAINEDISIIPKDVLFTDTFIGFKSKERLTITNNSNTILNFMWKKHEAKDTRTKSAISTSSSLTHMLHKSDADNARPSAADERSKLNIIQAGNFQLDPIQKPEPLFDDRYFVIEPLIGKIQPHSSKDIHILFHPMEAGRYEIRAFCDITGVENRIPVYMCGQGRGAKFKFGFDSLDTGEVYLGGGHTYEIPVTNISEIKGTVVFDGVSGLMPKISIKLEPKKINLAPGHYSAFYVNFNCSGNPGPFLEELRFRAPATDEVYTVTIKGSVHFPRLHFSIPVLEFGQVSYGFPKVEQIQLCNDTLNCVDINLRIDEDGIEPALTFEEVIASFEDEKIVLPIYPKEFLIEPTTFQLQPRGFQRLSVTLLSNNYGEYSRKLLVCIGEDPENIGDPVHALPIYADCVAPTLANDKPNMFLQNLYVSFPNPEEFHILNLTNLPGIYCLVPVIQEGNRVTLESDKFVGFLKPRKVTAIPFRLTCNVSGDSKAYAELYLAGKPEKVLDLEIKCNAIPCKLETNIKTVDFGVIPVLQYEEQTFEVINDSPLTIPFQAILVQGGNVGDEWILTPIFGTLEPYGRHPIKIELRLRESSVHAGTIRVQMLEANNAFIEIKVKATGVGTSLDITTPERKVPSDIAIVDFGTIFTKTEKLISFDITNLCFFPKVLEWKTSKQDPPENVKTKRRGGRVVEEPTSRLTKKPESAFAKKTKKSAFRMDPATILLSRNQAVTMNIKTSSETSRSVEEEYILWSYTPQNLDDNVKHLNKLSVRSVDLEVLAVWHQAYKPVVARRVLFKASYETPKIQFSKKGIIFKIYASPYDDNFEQKVSVKIDNYGTLPLPTIFQTEFPFTMMVKGPGGTRGTTPGLVNTDGESRRPDSNESEDLGTNDWSHTFQPGSSINMTINFDGRHVRKDKGSLYFESNLNVFYEGHPDSETIPLKGEVHFPSVEADKPAIDFGLIANGAEAVDTFVLTNVCNFCLTYKWFIRPNSTFIKQRPVARNSIAQRGNETLLFEADADQVNQPRQSAIAAKASVFDAPLQLPQPTSSVAAGSDISLLRRGGIHIHGDQEAREDVYPSSDEDDIRVFPKPSPTDEYGNSISMTHLDLFGDSVQFVRDKIHRTKFMDVVGLRDPTEDTVDEVHYLQKYNAYRALAPIQNHDDSIWSSANLNISELIDITPLSGIIQSGQQQRFTVVFYGHSEVHFKTVLTCHLEGGTAKHIPITGRSTKPTFDMLYPLNKHQKQMSIVRNSLMVPPPLASEPQQPPIADRKTTTTPAQKSKPKDVKARSKIPKMILPMKR